MKKLLCAVLTIFILTAVSHASDGTFEQRLQTIMNREEFKHSFFGIQFYSLQDRVPLFSMNAGKYFVPASTTKLTTTGTALALFGPDYRFQTHVYGTGPIDNEGTLSGDLILVASGDPNLSNRITADGKLIFEDADHSYGGEYSKGLPGDPLIVIRKFAKQVSERGVKRINGRVIVDASLFPQGERELGTGVVLSPIVVNDNVIDILVTPGASENAPAALKIRPLTSYVRLINKATTSKAGSDPDLQWESDIENSDGTRTVTLAGTIPSDIQSIMFSYAVPDPARFAEIVFTEALRVVGIVANPRLKEDAPDFKSLASNYTEKNQLGEHTSPPMSEEAKVILKVSQNLHASMMPYLLSVLVAKKEAPQAGFDLMKDFLTKAGLDVSGASQADGAGGSAHFTPEFMCRYLEFISKQKYAQVFHDALPILGKDGTLFQIQVDSPAAGNVFAKTGTYGQSDYLHRGLMVTSKALAGYMTTKSGKRLSFAIYINNVRVGLEPDAIRDIVGQAVGEIAAAAYETL